MMRLRQLSSVGFVLAVSGCSTFTSQAISGGAAPPAAKIAPASASGTLTALYSFQGQPDGANPQGAVDAITTCMSKCSTTVFGNTTSGGTSGAGTIYVLGGLFGPEKILLSYKPSQTGSNPTGPIIGPDGRAGLFGTASQGGLDDKGTVVELYGDLRSTFSTRVFSFDGHNGASPAGLVRKVGDRFIYYAVTPAGGLRHRGAIVSITLGHQKLMPRVLYSFSGKSDGEHPNSALTTTNINCCYRFYGTTAGSKSLMGTVYTFVPGHALTTLYTFQSSSDGATPTGVYADWVSTKETVLFGTTLKGGSSGYGTLYELKPNGSTYAKTTLHTFTSGSADGSFPQGPLAVDESTGMLYGVTKGGGSGGCGTIFSIDPSSGNYSSLYSFTCGNDGAYPEAPLTNSLNSMLLFGTTSAGGTANNGTVFSYSPP